MQKKNILIVDNNAIDLAVITSVMPTDHYTLQTTTDASEAIKILENAVPDLIIVDLQLASISGLDFIKFVRSDPKFDSIIIIALVSEKIVKSKELALQHGANGYADKPIDKVNLLCMIEGFLRAKPVK